MAIMHDSLFYTTIIRTICHPVRHVLPRDSCRVSFNDKKAFFEMTCQFTSRLLQHSGPYLCKSDIYYSHRVKSWQRYILVAQLSNESLVCAVNHNWARLSLFNGRLSRDFITGFITSRCFCRVSWHWVGLSMDCIFKHAALFYIFLCEFITKLSEIVPNWDQSCHKGTIVGNESRSCSSSLNVWKAIDWSRLTARIRMFLNLLSEKRGDSQQSFFSPYYL